jgi:hypothetical protein
MVFEFNRPVPQANPVKKDGDQVTIVFPKTAANKQCSVQAGIAKNKRIKSLILNQQGHNLCTIITMSSTGFTTKMRYLPKPERMILDIYGEPVNAEKTVTAVSTNNLQTIVPPAATVKQKERQLPAQSNDMTLFWSILMLINLIMVVILGLMQYALSKIKQRLFARWKQTPPDLTDKGIIDLDVKIQEEFKKYRGLTQTAPTEGI